MCRTEGASLSADTDIAVLRKVSGKGSGALFFGRAVVTRGLLPYSSAGLTEPHCAGIVHAGEEGESSANLSRSFFD